MSPRKHSKMKGNDLFALHKWLKQFSFTLTMNIWLFLIFGSCTQSSCEHSHIGHMFLFLLSKDLGVERMGWVIKRCKKLSQCFSKGYTILHSHKQWRRVSVASRPCQHLSCSVFINCNQPNEFMQWCFLYISFVFPSDSYVEHHFMCLRAICVSSFVSVQIFCPFFHWVVCNWLVRVLNIFSIQSLCLIFSPSLRLAFFIFLMVSSEAKKKN